MSEPCTRMFNMSALRAYVHFFILLLFVVFYCNSLDHSII